MVDSFESITIKSTPDSDACTHSSSFSKHVAGAESEFSPCQKQNPVSSVVYPVF